eukprot:TRINITY_DN6982_c0_g1_i2.p1 TRINITY_DN6982_c0_g1~~TRINITY_DN6982_c0_g1_i2.p1  ORF type:complete len:150 (+),score=11.45 TRINITY_DN6982_c0_g1_i2:173-622(+)
MAARYTKRLQKELLELQKSPPEGVRIQNVDNLQRWLVTIQGAPGSLYSGENFTLQFLFSQGYPLESPEVTFFGKAPVHPHIYSNGHICLSILYDQWSPALSVTSVCLSILSMLSSSPSKTPPPDNDHYVNNARGRSPKDTKWWFHDDSV